MFTWVATHDEHDRRAGGPACVLRFAAPQGPGPVRLVLHLRADVPADPPALTARASAGACAVEPPPGPGDSLRYVLTVGPPEDPARDDEVVVELAGPGVPPCRVVLRRSTCTFQTALIERDGAPALLPQTRAALLWQAWRRYAELVAVKRPGLGLSGSDVLVFRPRLRRPDPDRLANGEPADVLDRAWGSSLLVKTGKREDAHQEWQCSAALLADRLQPFLARCEAYLPVRPADEPGDEEAGPPALATLVSSFLGGDLIRTATLEQVVCGEADRGRCLRLLDRTFGILAPWHATACRRPLGQWRWVFGQDGDRLTLFTKYDLARKQQGDGRRGRQEYAAGLRWDVAFGDEKHLAGHLLGKGDGLLHRLRALETPFALTHGDLNARNILIDGDDVWLIDFAEAGVGPVYADFAWLEVNLRLWALTLAPASENVADAAEALERHLLDHFHGGEGSLDPVRRLAAGLGADPEQLVKVAHCIAHIRRLALAAAPGDALDHRDYLAVLYLTVLALLPHASGARSAPPENFRAAVSLAWVLEDALSRIVGLRPFDRARQPADPRHLLSRAWIAAPGAPGRARYLMEREDGRRALAPLAATRGVLQSQYHHLDVFDHTLLVLAHVEALLEDPLAGLQGPAALDARVAEDLRRQGVEVPPVPVPLPPGRRPAAAEAEPFLGEVGKLLAGALDDESRLLLKWVALLHDVGKPGTRALNTTGKGARVQFIGHELYGLDLLDRHLRYLFAEECPRGHGPMRLEARGWACRRCDRTHPRRPGEPLARVRDLIERHHLHHTLAGHYADPAARDVLKGLLRDAARGVPHLDYRGGVVKEMDFLGKRIEQGELPLLLLHGYADSLACRGPEAPADLAAVAETDLLVLAAATCWPRLREFRAWHDDFPKRTQGFLDELHITGPQWGKVRRPLQEWYMGERAARGDGDGPTRQELLDRARGLL